MGKVDPEREPELSVGLHGAATAEPGLTYRLLRGVWRVAAWVLRLRFEVEGLGSLPRDATGLPVGGWIAAGRSSSRRGRLD